MKRHLIVLTIVLISIIFLFFSCTLPKSSSSSSSSGSSNTGGTYTYGCTQSPGNYWEFTINQSSGTFAAVNYGATCGIVGPEALTPGYSGIVSGLSSGFLKFTVTQSNDRNVAISTVFFGIEFQGNFLLAAPTWWINNLIAGITKKTFNISNGANFAYIVMPYSGFYGSGTPNGASFSYGIGTINNINSTTFQTTNTILYNFDTTVSSKPTDTTLYFNSDCTASYIPSLSAPKAVTLATAGGGLITDCGDKSLLSTSLAGFITPMNISISDLVTKEFRGFITYYDNSSGNGVSITKGTICMWLRNLSANSMTAGSYVSNDPSQSEKTTGNTTLVFSNASQPYPGLITGATGSISGTSYTQSYIGIAEIVNGKYIIFAVGKDNNNAAFNFFAIEK